MDYSSATNLQIPLPLAYSAGILCVHMVYNWFGRCHAPCPNSKALFHSLIQPGTAESSIHDTQITPDSDINEEIEKRPAQQVVGLDDIGDTILSREEVEMVMGKLGIVCSSDSDQLKEYLGPVELSGLFEELEPSLDEVKETFSVFDANRDGFIDAEDLHGVLRKLGLSEGYSVNACERMIRAASNKGNDRIDLNEFVNFMENNLC